MQHLLRGEDANVGGEQGHSGNSALAVNLLHFRLLGLLPGCAVLSGTVERLTDENKSTQRQVASQLRFPSRLLFITKFSEEGNLFFFFFLTSYNRTVGPGAVVANFERPRLVIGPTMLPVPVFRAGPTSSVRRTWNSNALFPCHKLRVLLQVCLDTTYLGPRLRISRGASSGVPFLFTPIVPEVKRARGIDGCFSADVHQVI